MLRTLSVKKFRGLSDFKMEGLGRVNLLVGANNCGKTTVLEALHLLLMAGDPWPLWSMLSRRGEDIQVQHQAHYPQPRYAPEMDARHLFEGHEIALGSTFNITGVNDKERLTAEAEIVVLPSQFEQQARESDDQRGEQGDLFSSESIDSTLVSSRNLAVKLQWEYGELWFPLSRHGGIDQRAWEHRVFRTVVNQNVFSTVLFLTTGTLSVNATVSRLEDVMFTEYEDMVIGALQSIEPRLERITPLGTSVRSREPSGRGGVVVKLAGVRNRVPLGSLGDGMWRILGIALSLVKAKGGVLLIDEIDTGFHYTVMDNLWRLIYDGAKHLDVQVFAATHSRDCYQSLAAIVQKEKLSQPEVTIQRIERDNPIAVAFSDEEIIRAAERGIEVR